MELRWNDLDNYSELKTRDVMRIMVHRITHYPGWYLTCYKLQIKNKELKAEELKEAKAEAIKIVLDEIETLQKKTMYLAKHI